MTTVRIGRKLRVLLFSLIAVVALTAVGTWVIAAAGDLDPTFGTGGKVTTDIPTCCDESRDVAIQADGKIVVAGTVLDLSDSSVLDVDFALARYNSDGTLDPSFGNGGVVITKLFPGSADRAESVAIQPDGKIVVAGSIFLNRVGQFAVARYLPDGSLDTTFSDDGKALVPFPYDDAKAVAVGVQLDGRIVLMGQAWSDLTGYDFAAARLMADGTPDTSFGTSGIVTTPISTGKPEDTFSPDDIALAGALQPDGRILVAGYLTRPTDGNGDATIIRYLPNGTLDSGFGNGGIVAFNFYGPHAHLEALAVQPDGKIVVGGIAFNPTGFRREFGLARLDANGAFDPSFDDDGKVTTRMDPNDLWLTGLALHADGRIAAVGLFGNDIALAQYRTNGALDTSFSADGVTTTDLGGYELARAIAIQPDGKIVTAGNTLPLSGGGNFSNFLILRYEGGGGLVQQTIDFAPLVDRTFGDPPFVISATASSGLPVSFTASGGCSVLGSTVTITGSGSCSITASQDGDQTYAPAPDVTRTFQVLNARTLTMSRIGTGTGRVTSFPDGIDCGADCAETYQDGTTVTLSHIADAGSTFIAWGGDADCSDGVVILNANVACSATFDKTASVTTISSSLNPSTFGQQVTFTVGVTGTNPTGTVTIRDGAVTLASALPLTGGSATLSLSSLSPGTHSITAQYSGDSSNTGSTSTALSQVVNKATPTVTLSSSKNPSSPGEAVTFFGTVPSGATGTVTILDGAVSLGDAPVNGGGFALTTSTLGNGSHTMTARYNGDGNYLPADSTTVIQVVEQGNRAPQIIAVADQSLSWGFLLNIPVFATDADGDPLTFSLVAPPAGAAISSAGQLTWTPTSAQVGPTVITVQVTDGKQPVSTSFNVSVNKRSTFVIYLGPGAAASGPVQLSARLTDTQNAPIAGRTISFQVGTQSASGTTDGTGLAVATLALSQPVGTVTVTASFGGDAAYDPNSSSSPFRIDGAPVIAPIPPQSIPWGRTLTFIVEGSDPEGAALSFTLVNPPIGVGLVFESPTRRSVTWTPTQAQIGAASITIAVSDGVATVPVTVPVTVVRHATSITGIGPGVAGAGLVTLTATLTDVDAGSPLAGRPLMFVLGSQAIPATTNASGVASATLDLVQPPQTVPLVVSFAGDALLAPAQASRPFTIQLDTDGDGISDHWEINGVDVNGDGIIDLNLPAMGANPLRKDIFIEVDWMVKPTPCVWLVCWSNGGVLQPQRVVLDTLVARFANAPVSNPNGSTGISLHIDGGPTTVMNPASGEPWGPLSRAGVVPYVASLGSVDGLGNYDWSQFDSIKQVFFDAARRAVFHYVVYADTLAATSAAGISRGIPASDFVLAAGHPNWNGGLTATQESSLFVHELGHNLALHHGGADDINYKPNYHSVLNYLWSTTGLPPDNRADYSNVLEPPIDESIAGDVNNDGRIDTLLGYHDWPNIVFSGGSIGDLQAFPLPVATPIDPIDPDELRARGVYARNGDGLLEFKGPSLLATNSGVQSLIVDVKNISATDGDYVVSAESLFSGPLSAPTSVAAGGIGRVALLIDTTGLVPSEYMVTFTLRSAGGELLHRQLAKVIVVDLAVPENQQAAREALDALGALPVGSGLDPAIKDQIVRMLGAVAASWTVDLHVTGQPTFDEVYHIAEPNIRRAPGAITAQSPTGAPVFELNLVRAGKVASGFIRVQQPSGEMFEAAIAGSWNESTRVFDGKWLAGKRTVGRIVFTIRQPY